MDDVAIANALFGASSAPAAPPPPPAGETSPATEADTASKLYVSAEDRDPKDRSVPDSDSPGDQPMDPIYASTQRDIVSAAVDRLGLTEDAAADAGKQWAGVFREFGLVNQEAAELVSIGIGVQANGVTDEQVQTWATDARSALKAEYGARSDQVLAAAAALIAKQPTLARYLDRTGLGSHPRVVLAVAKSAQSKR